MGELIYKENILLGSKNATINAKNKWILKNFLTFNLSVDKLILLLKSSYINFKVIKLIIFHQSLKDKRTKIIINEFLRQISSRLS